jgi:hypothetical protein
MKQLEFDYEFTFDFPETRKALAQLQEACRHIKVTTRLIHEARDSDKRIARAAGSRSYALRSRIETIQHMWNERQPCEECERLGTWCNRAVCPN